jgi:hypothetical protein
MDDIAEVACQKVCPSVRTFTSSFSTALLRYRAVVKRGSGWLKFVLDTGLAADLKLHFPDLHAHLISNSLDPPPGMFEKQGYASIFHTRDEVWRRMKQRIRSDCSSHDRLCGLVVKVPGYRSRGPGSVPGAARFSEYS